MQDNNAYQAPMTMSQTETQRRPKEPSRFGWVEIIVVLVTTVVLFAMVDICDL